MTVETITANFHCTAFAYGHACLDCTQNGDNLSSGLATIRLSLSSTMLRGLGLLGAKSIQACEDLQMSSSGTREAGGAEACHGLTWIALQIWFVSNIFELSIYSQILCNPKVSSGQFLIWEGMKLDSSVIFQRLFHHLAQLSLPGIAHWKLVLMVT